MFVHLKTRTFAGIATIKVRNVHAGGEYQQFAMNILEQAERLTQNPSAFPMLVTVKPRYNAVSGRHLLRPPYKRGTL